MKQFRRRQISSADRRPCIAERLEPRRLLNAITQENALPGALPSQWYIAPGHADPSIQGFATDISVDRGQTISFKINDTAASPAYHLEIYRMGYYQGLGARLVSRVDPIAGQCLVTHQPDPIVDSATGLSDCGTWSVSATWQVPATATSGVYFANIVRNDGRGKSRIPFIVRDDTSHSDLLFQTSDATWEAYNYYGTPENPLGGKSLYDGIGQARGAFAVSYNRPFVQGDYNTSTINSFFFSEYPMVRFLEKNGYDVSYFSGVDADRLGAQYIENHKAYLSVGHDEYWSGGQRANVQAARDHGVSLAFFSGNEAAWKTRFQPSIDGSGTGYRTLVCYKESTSGVRDPKEPLSSTGFWRDPRFGPPADAAQPENALKGALYTVNWYDNSTDTARGWNAPIVVPWTAAPLRFWRNTAIAHLGRGRHYISGAGYLGYEWDEDIDNGSRPAGLMDLSSTTLELGAPGGPGMGGGKLVDSRGWYERSFATHSLTLFHAATGALVFDAGTIQWSWALNSDQWNGMNFHWYQQNGSIRTPVPVDRNLQQATVNLLADMGGQPQTLEPGLLPAKQSTDRTPPVSQISTPRPSSNLTGAVLITGTAKDVGGVVAAVEVSTNGGATWHPASGATEWSYTWVPTTAGTFIIESRAVDDSGNIETSTARETVTVRPALVSLFTGTVAPSSASDPNVPAHYGGMELGMRFTSNVGGYIAGVKFWRLAGDASEHTGELWDGTGHLLATAEFLSGSSAGWQQALFTTPVYIRPGLPYVVSYHSTNPTIAYTRGGLLSAVANGPLIAPAAHSTPAGNGIFSYDHPNYTRFPTTPTGANYWVDVLFQSVLAG